MRRAAALALAAGLALAEAAPAAEPWETRAEGSVRVAIFNAGLVRKGAGLLAAEIEAGSPQVDAIAEIVLRIRPDILLLIKFDRDEALRALAGFAGRLREGVAGLEGLDYPFLYQGSVNAGVPSGLDLDGDGKRYGPRDAFGYGRFPGQAAMALMSRLPVDFDRIRSFREFRWAALPGADRPVKPDGTPFHADEVWQALRLSSVSYWDVPVTLPRDRVLHLLAAHATPPVFDGPEDLNGRRNADEIRLLGAIAAGADWVEDDRGRRGGLAPGDRFVIAADLNSDPFDGDSRHAAVRAAGRSGPTGPGAREPRRRGGRRSGPCRASGPRHRGFPRRRAGKPADRLPPALGGADRHRGGGVLARRRRPARPAGRRRAAAGELGPPAGLGGYPRGVVGSDAAGAGSVAGEPAGRLLPLQGGGWVGVHDAGRKRS